MGLTTPLALLGLLGVALPILAHFVRSRQLPVQPFPALMLLAKASQARRRQSALADRLLLALRVAAVAALVFATAGPTLRLSGPMRGGVQDLVIVLDDSLSMSRVDGSTTPLARARAELRSELAQLPAGSSVALVLAGQPARVVLPTGSSPTEVTAALDRRATTRGGDMPRAFELARRELGRAAHGRRRLLVLSDMARHSDMTDVDWSAAHVPVAFFDAHTDQAPENRRIVAVESDLRGSRGQLDVSAAGITKDTFVTLRVREREVARGLMTAGPGIRRVTLSFARETEEMAPAEVRLAGEDALSADDAWPLWLRRDPRAALLIVDGAPDPTGRHGESSFLTRALEAGQSLGAPSFRVVDEAALADLTPGAHAGVILAGALPSPRAVDALHRFVRGGGGLWVAPSIKLRWRAINGRLGDLLPVYLGAPVRTASTITLGEPAPPLREADFAGSTIGDFLFLEDPLDHASVWLRHGSPLLVEGRSGRGSVFVMGTPFGDGLGDFPYRPGFLPLVMKVCARLVGHTPHGASVVSAGGIAPLPSGIVAGEVEDPSGASHALPADGRFRDTSRTGLYRVTDGAGPRPRLSFAVVAPPSEGDLDSAPAPADIQGDDDDALRSERARSEPLQGWFYLFAGLLVAGEGILRASRLSPSRGARR